MGWWQTALQRCRLEAACLAAVLAVVLTALAASANAQPLRASETDDDFPELVAREDDAPRRWWILFSMVNAYPKLERETLIEEVFDPIIGVLSPGYGGTRTFTEMRDKGLLWPPQIGFGRMMSDHWALSFHFGYSAGKVHTDDTNPSLLFGAPLHVDFEIRRSALYAGLDLDVYPFGAAELREYASWGERFRAAKPALGTRLTWTEAGFDAQVKLGIGRVKLAEINLEDTWLIPSVNVNVGVDVPLGKRSVLVFNAGYNFFKEEKQDFDGPAFTVAYRYFLW